MVYFGLILWVSIMSPAFCVQIKVDKISGIQDQVGSSHPAVRLLWLCDPRSSSSKVEQVSPKSAHTNTHKQPQRRTQRASHKHTAVTQTWAAQTPHCLPPPQLAGIEVATGIRRVGIFFQQLDLDSFWSIWPRGPSPCLRLLPGLSNPCGISLAPDLPLCLQPAWLAARHIYVLAHNSELPGTGERIRI